MGVPKFFRWLSERYPAISQLIAENRIPEFDCLYLDMNGIIHNCTHKDSDSPTFRMTEDKMFIAIFNYIEHLFGKIKPKKLFFMAIDGVAPRAKMNQQRARRFRTALDADLARQKAVQQGVEMPKEDAFDSNCITPGTAFMAKLTEQLKYFIHKKVSEDAEWQGIEIVLSGHEVPGEGEHKVMEYIRLAKAQPDYDPNIRHCLYGLDADLIMLGLLSHDPHFCLLREEVTFGRTQKKSKELEHQNFYLMHLSVVREYLEHEFQELQEPGKLKFEFNLERVIDDFILLAFFVGNDFLPHLPNLHINEGALFLMFKSYKTILPKANGYINDHGSIDLDRLAMLLEELEKFELTVFENECSDANWFKGKQRKEVEALEKGRGKNRLVLTKQQKELYSGIRKYVEKRMGNKEAEPYDLPVMLPAKDRKFVEDLASSLRLRVESILDDDGSRHLRLLPFPTDVKEEMDSEDEEESQVAIFRVLRQYDKASVVELSPEQEQEEIAKKHQEKFQEWRDDYYKDKFGFGLQDDDEMQKLAENYVQGLQWVLYYYYKGVASWPWFYRYHYSPKISDIRKGLKADLNFRLGIPFKPYEQLMGVLPDRSKKIVPVAYHPLMTDPKSPIIDFYPRDFELDKNGKKQDWEAVVKIPFIEEGRLLSAMRSVEHLLTDDERARNSFGSTLKFSYDEEADFEYPSSMEGIFPPVDHCHCVVNIFELPTLEGLEIIVGLCDGAKLGVDALAGFPSLKTIPHTAQLGFHGVNIFQMDSRNESMVITFSNSYEVSKVEEAKKKIGKRVFVGYPFLHEAMVDSVSDELFRYIPNGAQTIPVPHGPRELDQWRAKADRIENQYSKRLGMIIGPVEVVLHVSMLKGLRRTDNGAMIKDYAILQGVDTDYALQAVVDDVISEDQRFLEKEAIPIELEFPEGTRAFFLGDFAYGRPLEVIYTRDGKVDIWVALSKVKEPDTKEIVKREQSKSVYVPAYQVARQLGLNGLVLSKITSSFSVMCGDERQNLGLNLKFEAKKLKVLGYSRKRNNTWEFSQKAIALLQEYIKKFPEFFTALQRNPQGDIYQDTEFYDASIAKQKIQEIKNWLKENESRGFEKVPLDADQLDASVVGQLEAAVDIATQTQEIEAKRINRVPRKALLKPADAEHRLADQVFSIGDRVVYVQDSGKVPIGSRGTVIGVTTTARMTMLDILYDSTFMSGTTLTDRCSPFRGMTVPIVSVLNLTNRQVVADTAASRQNQQAQHNANTPQMSNTPPPLRGPYSGALNGSLPPHQQQPPVANGRGGGRGGRGGRGGHMSPTPGQQTNGNGQQGAYAPHQGQNNRGGSRGGMGNYQARGGAPAILLRPTQNESPAVVASVAQQDGTGDFQQKRLLPRSYQNVPPPANLNQRGGRGRGFSRGGGRGGRGGRTESTGSS